jgi:hypothetical protein
MAWFLSVTRTRANGARMVPPTSGAGLYCCLATDASRKVHQSHTGAIGNNVASLRRLFR